MQQTVQYESNYNPLSPLYIIIEKRKSDQIEDKPFAIFVRCGSIIIIIMK